MAGYLPRTDIATRNSTAVMQEPRDAAEQMEALSRAFARNDESLRERTDEVERLRGTLAEYEELRSTLRTLPERVEHEVMIRVRARGWSAASAPISRAPLGLVRVRVRVEHEV